LRLHRSNVRQRSARSRFDNLKSRETLLPANAKWISSNSTYRAVSDIEYTTELERLAKSNPMRIPRRRMQLRRENQQRLAEPYIVAAGIFSQKLGKRATSLRMKWQGTSWSHSATENLRRFDGVSLEDTGTQMFLEGDDYVLREKNRTGLVFGREPVAIVESSVDAAKRAPVVEAAEFAVPKVSGDADSVVNIIECGGKDATGAWIWVAYSGGRPYRMTRSGDIIRVEGPGGGCGDNRSGVGAVHRFIDLSIQGCEPQSMAVSIRSLVMPNRCPLLENAAVTRIKRTLSAQGHVQASTWHAGDGRSSRKAAIAPAKLTLSTLTTLGLIPAL
jgi:hypothetical protein